MTHSGDELSVLSYNIYMRWPTWLFRDDHDLRADLIPGHVRGFDMVVFQEAFADAQRDRMLGELRDEYPHRTRPLGDNEFFSHNGGVMILSRWPILTQDQTVFDGCAGSDCMVKKGVVYAAIDWKGHRVHLFGLHLQAQREYAQQRVAQFPQLKAFIDAQKIPADELVLVAGDFNVDYYSDDVDGEFSKLTDEVGLVLRDEQLAPSYDQSSNSYTEEPVSERLDYVFFSSHHLTPEAASNEVLRFREGDRDLSDHHPVVGRFVLEALND